MHYQSTFVIRFVFSLSKLPCLSFASLIFLRFGSNLLIIVMMMCTHLIVDAVNLSSDDDLVLGGDDDLDLGHQSNQLIEKLGDQQP